jgi:hypothetical protein
MKSAMTQITSFRSVVELWGPKDAFGARRDMAAEIGVSSSVVAKWWQRNWIPPEYWSAILSTDRARDAGLSAELLTGLAAREVVDEARA